MESTVADRRWLARWPFAAAGREMAVCQAAGREMAVCQAKGRGPPHFGQVQSMRTWPKWGGSRSVELDQTVQCPGFKTSHECG